ncbi:MAG: lysophospholipid acyltransferase family protein [Desulfovibrionaceae bacterium]|nr:lysophospholipid acyltransferase family protein [Desulfovibrionaceae bacterium]
MARLNIARLAPLIVWTYRAWCATLRMDVRGYERIREVRATGRRLVFALWHDEQFMIINAREALHLVAVVSASSDGDILAGVLEGLGIRAARGSSSRGGLRALHGALKLMEEEGRDMVTTIDGPRGPRHEVKEGVLYLAHKTNALVVPLRARGERVKVFERAWDKFQLPLPFSRCTVVFGEPFELEQGKMDAEMLRREKAVLQERLDNLLEAHA